MEKAASLLATRLPFSENCSIQETNPNTSINFLKNKQGCVLKFEQHLYFYTLQDLGLFPCLKIGNQSSHHWQLTLFENNLMPKILQLRIANPDQFLACIKYLSRAIKPGVQSWRYLS
jgi:hypothetical protein